MVVDTGTHWFMLLGTVLGKIRMLAKHKENQVVNVKVLRTKLIKLMKIISNASVVKIYNETFNDDFKLVEPND